MQRTPVDLAAHINRTVERGHPADFPVGLRPVFYAKEGSFEPISQRMAVIREDTGEAISVVSDRYTLVPHDRILDLVERAIAPLDVGPVPRGVFVDRKGARMRALFKFPALTKSVVGDDTICPCLKISNAYDGTSGISIHIGAFRFVCTNLAVGGGGIFAGGFMSVHAGEIPIEEVADQLARYLEGFEGIVELYRRWSATRLDGALFNEILDDLPQGPAKLIGRAVDERRGASVYDAYNVATRHATHEMRSHRTAFELLARINASFQDHFPLPAAASPPVPVAAADPTHSVA